MIVIVVRFTQLRYSDVGMTVISAVEGAFIDRITLHDQTLPIAGAIPAAPPRNIERRRQLCVTMSIRGTNTHSSFISAVVER